MVRLAIKKGILIKPEICELCQKRAQYIAAHHYNGYEEKNVLDIWWICASCNGRLLGCHDGRLAKDEVREIFRKYTTILDAADEFEVSRTTVMNRIKAGLFPGAVRLSEVTNNPPAKTDLWLIPVEDLKSMVDGS